MNITRDLRHPTPTPTERFKVPWWTRGDTNAFFGLGVQHPGQRADPDLAVDLRGARSRPSSVLGTVLPALGIALIVGNVYYTFLARRLARREQPHRRDGDAVRAERPAHVHRRLRDHAADLPARPATRSGPGRPGWPGRSSSA